MSKKFLSFTVAAGLGFTALTILGSCGSGGGNKPTNIDSATSDSKKLDSLTKEKKNKIAFKFATAETNMPSPFEVVNDVSAFQTDCKKDLLNDYTKADSYVSSFKKAVNMGIYGIDLAYVNCYGQNQEMLHYFTTIQKLSKELSFEKVFDEYSERFKSNSGNKDSVAQLADAVFASTDDYLKKNEKLLVSSQIMAGALIEINYLSINLLKDVKKTPENSAAFEKVYNENAVLYHLSDLFKELTSDKDSKDLLAKLDAYRTSFDGVIKSANDMTPENLAKATQLVTDLRKGLTQK